MGFEVHGEVDGSLFTVVWNSVGARALPMAGSVTGHQSLVTSKSVIGASAAVIRERFNGDSGWKLTLAS